MATSPTIVYPASNAPQGSGLGIVEAWYPDITWTDGSAITWTNGEPIEWIGNVDTAPDLSTPRSARVSPTIVHTGQGEV